MSFIPGDAHVLFILLIFIVVENNFGFKLVVWLIVLLSFASQSFNKSYSLYDSSFNNNLSTPYK